MAVPAMIPHAEHQLIQQSWTMSCGAACLLCAALELGFIHVTDLREYERKIYKITSIKGRALGDDSDPNTWGYNMPSNIVECCENMPRIPETMLPIKIPARVIAHSSNPAFNFLTKRFEEEYDHLKTWIEQRKYIEVKPTDTERFPIPLAGPLRELKVLYSVSEIGEHVLHYVMVRPGGSVMDPAQPMNYPSFADALHGIYDMQKITMSDTGLSVFIGKG